MSIDEPPNLRVQWSGKKKKCDGGAVSSKRSHDSIVSEKIPKSLKRLKRI